MKKVCMIGGSPAYDRMFEKRGWEVVYFPEGADLLQFTGGADVSPELYGEERHERTLPNPIRDEEEQRKYEYAIANNIPMSGICRGAQFLNVMCGGLLYQHVDNHTMSHNLLTLDTLDVFEVTSTHHQMMRPTLSAKILAVAAPKLALTKQYVREGVVHDDGDMGEDIEALYYEDQRCLCFQPHPEMFIGRMQDYYFECIEKYLGVK